MFQFRRLRHCDVRTISMVAQYETAAGTVSFTRARVDGELMLVRSYKMLTNEPSEASQDILAEISRVASAYPAIL